VPEDDLTRLGLLMLENGKSADLKAVARALEQAHKSGGLVKAPPTSALLLVVAHFRANEMDLMKEQYRLLQPALQGWTPKIADWPKIVEAAKAGKSDAPGPRKRPATGPATR
jgi:hypothetical protein